MNKWIEILNNNDYIGAKKYIKEGADLNDENDNGESVLAHALRYRVDSDLLMLLIEKGADIYDFDNEGVSIFDMAITYDNKEIVEFLIEKGVDINTTSRRSKFTPLMCACCYGRLDIVKFLLENGADKTQCDYKGLSALDFATKMNKKSVIKLLED